MRRILRLLVRLYPLAWRSRYGDEFEALLEDRAPCLLDAFDIFLGALKTQVTSWSFVRVTLASCLLGLVAALGVSFAVPARYDSHTLITVMPGVDVADVQGKNLGQDAATAELVSIMKDGFLNSEFLASIIQEQNLYPQERSRVSLDAVVNRMRRDIHIRPVQPGYLSRVLTGVDLQFNYSEPHVAQQVDAALASRLMGATLHYREVSAVRSDLIFSEVNAPSLPQKPSFPNRSEFGAAGLFAGLASGLMLAAVIRMLRNRSALNVE
jgi:hypothetical protein